MASIGILLTLYTITPIISSKSDASYKPEIFVKKHKTIQSFLDSKSSENGRYKSYLSPDQSRKLSNTDFSQLRKDVDEHLQDFNFDPKDFDKIKLPRSQSTQPKFVLNYEPLRSSNYLSRPSSTRYGRYPFNTPEHQDDGGDGGGDDDDGGDGDGGGGGGGGGASSGGNRGGGGDEDDGRFLENFEIYDDNYELQDGWKPVRNNYESDVSNKYFGIPKNIGYNANKLSTGPSNNYQKPYIPRPVYKKKQSQKFSENPQSRKLANNKRPYSVFEEESLVFKKKGNNRRLPKKSRKKEQLSSDDDDDFGPSSILDGDTEEEDDHSPLQSKPLPTKKRQVCRKISKSMTPNDIEDHDVIGRKMSCMVCKDFASGGSFEKCSYKSSPKTDEYFKDPDEISKPRHKSSRFKRRAYNRKRKPRESGEEVDDYYESANLGESGEDSDAVAEYNSSDPENYETAENESEEYAMPSMPTESATCHKVKRNGNVCNVCQDNLSNRQFEQCEYEIEPKKNAYEYSTRNVYGPRYKRQLENDRTYDDYFKKLFPELGLSRKSSIATKFSSKDGDFGLLDSGKIGFKKSRPSSLLGDKDLSIDFDSLEESPVNRMLGEFRNKDRSNCQKSIKDKMTCYKCKNDKGAESEECMYIADGKPSDRKQSYHETKKFNSSPESAETDNKPVLKNSTQQLASSSLAHVYAPLYSAKYEPTAQHSHVRPNRHRNYRLRMAPVDEDATESVEEEDDADQAEAQSVEDYDYPEDPSARQVSRHDLPEIDPFGPEGAYSEETVPVYDSSLGTWLPKYMVVKSSQEEMVDEELGLD